MSHIENKPYAWLLETGEAATTTDYELHLTLLLPAGIKMKTGSLEDDNTSYADDVDGHPQDKKLKLVLEPLAAATGGLAVPTTASIAGVSFDTAAWEKKGVVVRITMFGDATKPVRGKVKANYSAADTDSNGGGIGRP